MLTSAIVAYFHYFSFLLATAALMVEALTLKPTLERSEAWRIVIADALYGIAALGVLATGILRVLYFGQGSEFYTHNPVFWVKVGLYILIGALSLFPTISFLFWIPGLQKEELPQPTPQRVSQLQWVIRSELVGFALIPLFAALMARGIGL
jgi:putative membrane protein